jgi:DNA-binding NtrC family response regulator
MSTMSGATAIIGESAAIVRLREMIAIAAPTRLPVLIQGPTGTGKELVAAALHEASGRRGSFVAFNVCAIGESMFEDALFGHVRGAYTGALSDAAGFLVEADRGTAFFDEIGGLQPGLQAKLLRALETGEFRPIGGKRDSRSDFRVVSATNESISQLVSEKRMRPDLAHRIGAVVLEVPALRDRPDDVPLLVSYFLRRVGRVGGEPGVTTDAIRALQAYHWPGNVRELRQVVEWANVLGPGTITLDVTRAALSQRAASHQSTEATSTERRELCAVLDRHEGNTEAAARELGVHRATLYRRMRLLRVTATSRRGRAGLSGESEARAG